MGSPDQKFADMSVNVAAEAASAPQANDGSPTISSSPAITSAAAVASPTLDTKDILKNASQYPGAFTDFHGLPSNPICVYRTGDEWPIPTGFEAQPVLREARPICIHPIQKVWYELGTQIYEYLDSLEVKWSTIDPVRFAEKGKDSGPLHLWIGVAPRSLSLEDAKDAATGCKKILADAGLPDVEIAFRESHFIRSSSLAPACPGPQLLHYVPYIDPTADVSSPFTPALGIRIAPQETPYIEGTGALYLHEGGQSNRILVLTTRHVALPPLMHGNEPYVHDTSSQHTENALILGNGAYEDATENMLDQIQCETISANTCEEELGVLGEATDCDDDAVNYKLVRARSGREG